MQKNQKDKIAALDKTLAEINKKFGPGSVMRLGDRNSMNVETLSTGSFLVDLALGVGGLPLGRICEIFGPESSGKTTFCLSVVAQAQQRGYDAAFIDVEHALDPDYAQKLGINLHRLAVSQPGTGESALQIMDSLIQSGAFRVVVLDSVAALVTQAELDGQIGEMTVAAQARLMGQAMRHLTASASRAGCICLFTNQIREKIGVVYGSSEVTPGGRALKFFSSVRLDIRRLTTIKDSEGRAIGSQTRVRVVKNKVAPPFRECKFDLFFSEGISRLGELIELAEKYKIFARRGAWFFYGDRQLGQGRGAVRALLEREVDFAKTIEEQIKSCIQSSDDQSLEEALDSQVDPSKTEEK